jgi:hypothetical protein
MLKDPPPLFGFAAEESTNKTPFPVADTVLVILTPAPLRLAVLDGEAPVMRTLRGAGATWRGCVDGSSTTSGFSSGGSLVSEDGASESRLVSTLR